MRVLFLINDGFEETETTAPIDILKRAGVEVYIASTYSKVEGAHKITLSNVLAMGDINYKAFDLLVLPGGPQWKANSQNELYIEIMKYFVENKSIAAICASPTIIGSHGYLKGKKYTCFPPMNKDFGGTFIDVPAITDGNIITGRSAGSSLEFGYEIVKYILGEEKATEVRNSMY